MHLKTLTLRGFKSFAQATTLRFEPGITCVVGPNGSGKSNVVDALSWVMGEQGAKSLRGGSMADVIFAGTSKRQALGRAEVSLTIDNADGALPIDYAEVTISRTLFRSGGSEYAINGTACRLLDIQELLSDTGMGRQMHVIVGQGQLDKILHATAEERRGFIEEAAGVLKHRRRKEKALRKLEAMAANLVRVEDLTAEIRRQLGPLARQADVARRAGKIQAAARDAKSRLYADDYAQLVARLHSETAGEAELAAERTKVGAQLQALREDLTAAERRGAEFTPQVRAATDVRVELTTLQERLNTIHQLASERSRHLSAPPPRFSGPSPSELNEQAEALASNETQLRSEVEAAERALDEASSKREQAEDEEARAESALQALHRAVADRREGLAKLAGKVAAHRSRIEAATAERTRLCANLAQAEQRLATAEHSYTTLEAEIAAHEDDGDAESAHAEALNVAAARDKHARELREALHQAASDANGARTRQETLALSLRSEDAATKLREAGQVGALISEVLRVEEPWRAAIAAALDGFAEAALTTDPTAALAYAQSHELGEVRLLFAPPAHTAAAPVQLPAGARWAREVLTCTDPAWQEVIEAALANVVLVDSDQMASSVTRAHHHLLAVTPGATVRGAWHLRGGKGGGASQIELQALHDEAQAAGERYARRVETLQTELAKADAAAEAARQHVAACLHAVREADAQRAASNQRLAQLGATVRSAQAEVQRTGPAIADLDEQLQVQSAELAELQQRLAAAEAEPADTQSHLGEAQQRRDDAALGASAARRTETDARLALRTGQERLAAVAGRAEALRERAAAEAASRKRAERRHARRVEAAKGADRVRSQTEAALAAMVTSLELARSEEQRLEAAAAAHSAEVAQLRSCHDEVATRLSELTDAAHREELARAQLAVQVDAAAEKIHAELGVEPDVLLAEYGPDQPVPTDDGEQVPYVRSEQEKRLQRAERDIKRLGKINPLALEEHAALSERHEFLSTQVADLKKSRQDLLTIVREIDERVERVFAEAFADTAREFETVFTRLFPGGEGKLVLTDPADMLTTGIEVEARPAGKRVKRLSLLSGGERSLTAVAMLVAIFRARPSPFYVMDEVEAALDDRNLDRLLTIFKELQRDSQLIVITHQKRTMETADALYGVSMRDGVSQVISQRVD